MKRAVIFGLDGATYTVLDHLVANGVMPYLGQFMAGGTRATLLSNIPPLTPPAWTTLVTGRTPGHHGITGFFQYESPESSVIQIVSARHVRCESIWSIVNRFGMRAGSLNFVVHHPAPAVDGYIVPGWTPGRWMKRMSYPRDLLERVARDLPGFDLKEIGMDFDQERKSVAGEAIEDFRAWIDLHIRRDRQWFALMRHQMRHDSCHLTAVVFDGVDKIQHSFWPYLDPRLEPRDPSPNYLAIREACWDYFRNVDDFLRETVEMAGDDAAVFVVSDHGFTGTDEIVYINTWLEREGYLTWKQGTEIADDTRELEPDFYRLSAFDMTQTRAFALTASSNGIHIVVRGKKGEHGIAPEEYEGFRRKLCEALLTRCVDPSTGETLVSGVWTREEVFAGPHMELAPDLTLELRDHGFFSVRRSQTILRKRPHIMGTHHPEGIFLARGTGIKAGARPKEAVRLIDVAPTVLNELGVPIPENLDGRILDEIFETQRLAVNTPRRSEPALVMAAAAASDGEALEDDPIVLERLKALGYIE